MTCDAQTRNVSCAELLGEAVRMSEYVKGAEPDRWHWIKDCKMYPHVVIQKRGSRPPHDLCDECQELEKKALLKTAAT